MAKDTSRKRATRAAASAAGASYTAAHNAAKRMFLPSTKFLIDSREIAVYRDPTQEWNLHEAYYVRFRHTAEAAWVRWERPPEQDFDGRLRGTVRVLTLACIATHCRGRTQARCVCDIAWCTEHMTQHVATEHVAPSAGRYQAALAADPALPRFTPARTTPIEGLYPRDLTLDYLRPASKRHDTIRVLESIRRLAIYDPTAPDPLLDALASAVRRGTVPTSARARWIAADILARCTWPAVLDAIGHDDAAAWMRRQPPITSKKTTPLTERVNELDRGIDVPRAGGQPRQVGLTAAADALAGLCRVVPSSIGLGAFGYINSVCAEYFAHVLGQPDGPERVGTAVARAQRDGIRMMLGSLQP